MGRAAPTERVPFGATGVKKPTERQQEILNILAQEPETSVAQIAQSLEVSEVTIRSDLSSLEESGYVVRTHGGASPSFHRDILDRQRHRTKEKQRIAQAAASRVQDGDTVMIEAGTTTALVARFLLGRRDVHIVTNSTLVLPFARVNPGIRVTVTGGEFRPITESFVGPIATRQLEEFHVRFAFVGTDGFGLEHGLTTHLVEGAEIVRTMARCADSTILVADSSKLGKAGFVRVLPLSRIDELVVDDGLSPEEVEAIAEQGVKVEGVK